MTVHLAIACIGLRVGLVHAQPAPPATEDQLDVPGQYATDLRGDALVWEDARFYLEPWEGATSVQFSSLSRVRRDEIGRAVPVRIVGAALRSFVEIELPNRADCTMRRIEADPRIGSLRLFVRREDLAPVLVKPFAQTFGDGTSVKLAVGVPVMPTATGHYLISVRGDRLRLAIPHGHVGWTYQHRPVVEEPPKSPVVRIERLNAPRIGDVPFEVRQYWVAPKPPKTGGENTLLRWTARCMELVVSVPTSSVRPTELPTPYPQRNTIAPPPPPSTWRIPVGAPLATVEGREVAVATRPIPIAAKAGDTACFEARLGLVPIENIRYEVVRTFPLCAAASVLEAEPAPGEVGKVRTQSPSELPAPADVAAPPAGASRTTKGVRWKLLGPRKRGAKPTPASTVKVSYTGWTTDGKMFDSTLTRGVPASFRLDATIAGFTDGLQQMHVGERARLWIPAELAYARRPHGPQGMLVFDVELLAIE